MNAVFTHFKWVVFTAFATIYNVGLCQAGALDLTELHDYANQQVPNYINDDNTPGTNPITDLGATLGRVLFYDNRLSVNDTISCASCHQQAHAFSDLGQASTGVDGTTGRHSMRLINARFADETQFFWDERAVTLEAQTSQPIQDHVEMGFSGANGDPSFADLITKLSAIEEYQMLFTGVFGDATITEQRVQQSLAQFVRSIQSFDSKYDIGRSLVNNDAAAFPNFSPEENAGKQLFMARPNQGRTANCNVCHSAPEFDIVPNSQNNGVVGSIGGGIDITNTRSPSLRDITKADGSLNGPLMHNGAFTTLRQMIDHYNAIPGNPANLDQRLRRNNQPQRLNLTEIEKQNLEAFLKTLSGTNVYTDVRWSDPFDASGQLTLTVLPTNQLTISLDPNNNQAQIETTGVPNLTYQLEQSTDLITWTTTPVTADANGNISVTTATTEVKQFYRIVYTPN